MKLNGPRALFFWLLPLLAAVIVTVVFVGWGLHSIATSRSSTAAIGYIFLPFYAAGVALASFVVFWAVTYSFCFFLERLGLLSSGLTSAGPLLAAVLILLATMLIARYEISRHTLLVAAKRSPPSAEMIDRALATHDFQILARLAKNPNTSVSDLSRIFDACKSNVEAANPPEYIVLHSLAQNRRTPSDVLRMLGKCRGTSIRVAVATNQNTPTEILPDLARDKENLVRTWVTTNPNISEELLRQLAKDDDRVTRSYADSVLRRRKNSAKKNE